MMKTMMVKALAIGLLSHALISGTANAGGPTACPAFNAAMLDAAAMAAVLVGDLVPGSVFDDPAETPLAAPQPETEGELNSFPGGGEEESSRLR